MDLSNYHVAQMSLVSTNPVIAAVLRRRVESLPDRLEVLDRRGVLARRGRHRCHLHLVLARHLGLPIHQVHEVSHFLARLKKSLP